MTPRAWILQTAAEFRTAGIPDPVNDSALILAHVTGRRPLELRADMDSEIGEEAGKQADALRLRRLTREPLQYILGEAPFCGRIFAAGPGMLIPRPETEELCLWALETIRGLKSPRILDVCAGSGCIGLTMQMERPDAKVVLLELSEEALIRLEENQHRFSAEAEIRKSDLFSALEENERFDLILSNPPYIPTEECPTLQEEVLYEPRMALDGGADGLKFYRRIALEAGRHMVPGGRLMMETGDGEADAVSQILQESGWRDAVIRRDMSGKERMICADAPAMSEEKECREEI